MVRFKDLSIRTKVTLMLMGVSTAALLIGSLTFYFLIIDRYQESYQNDLHILAKIVGVNCSASLAFGVSEDAKGLLGSLRKKPSIIAVTIHDRAGNLFASYHSNQFIKNPEEIHSVSLLENSTHDNLSISEKIEMNGQQIGEISFDDDMRGLASFKKIALMILAGIIVVVLGITALLAAKLRELISTPISNLATIAQKISTNQDYSLRATKESTDEIGNLVDSFNTMLTQIALRSDALHKSEKRFRSLINQAVDSFFLFDLDGHFIDVNRQACNCLGYSRDELLAMKVTDINAKATNQLDKDAYWTKMRPGTSTTLESMYLRKNGKSYPVEERIGILELGDEKFILVLARDISERLESEKNRQQLEAQLQQAQKMEAIGTLAGGIAHDFNNLLTPIIGYSELLLLGLTADSTVPKQIQPILTAANRAKDLVKQILTFSRRSEHNLAPLNVEPVIKEALKLLRSSIPSSIEMQQNINPECGAVLADLAQIHQIIMNLCTNAYQAIGGQSGIISVSLSPVILAQADIASKVGLQPGQYLKLVVEDSGEGIDQKSLKRIFEPYFTTKEKGKGTGLGLAVVHGIVKNYGGEINVYSELGKGTRFNIYLPVVSTETPQEKESREEPLQTGTEKLLLVDDEELITQHGQIFLETLGYQVTSCNDPTEALSLFSNEPNRFDLVITDMTMPKLTGALLSQKLLTMRKDLPIIMCTGFSETIDEETAKQFGIRAFLMKPVSSHDLAATIRTVLDTK